MDTQYFDATIQREAGTRACGAIIRSGGLVAFPTETVYGLGANGLDGEAVAGIFEAKGRPADNPLILHVARKGDARALWHSVPDAARRLMDAFWPGPLTIIYRRSSIVPGTVTAGLDTVAVRMPSHKTALALIRAANVPIAAPSANLSGRPSPTRAEHVMEDLAGRIDAVIDGGPCQVGLESTVVTLAGTPTILRPGGVTREAIEGIIGPVELSPAALAPLKEGEAAPSPGMKYRHYAPQAQVIAATGEPRTAAAKICREYDLMELEGKSCVIFASAQARPFYHGRRYVIIGDREEPATFCNSLFASLREYGGEADAIFCECLPSFDLGLAYMNRLLRAAGFTTI